MKHRPRLPRSALLADNTPQVIQIVCLSLFVIGAMVTFAFVQANERQTTERSKIYTSQQAATAKNHIEHEISQYGQLLRSAAAFTSVDGIEVTRERWNAFVQRSEVTQRFPAIVGIGYVRATNEQLLADAQADLSAQYGRSVQYQALGAHAPSTMIAYLVPESADNLAAVGVDMFSEAKRRAAMQRARDEHRVALSEPVQLVQDRNSPTVRGVLLYYPVYDTTLPVKTVEQRQAALRGYTYIVTRPQDMAARIDRTTIDKQAVFSIQTGDTVLYHQADVTSDMTTASETMRLGVQRWTITAALNRDANLERRDSLAIMVLGTFASGLFAVVLYLLLSARVRKLALQHKATVDETKSELVMLTSHQLRTPATGVKQYLGMLTDGMMGELTSAQQKLAKKAYAANERQIETIDQILHVAKADAGQLRIEPAKTNLSALVEQTIDGMHDDAARKNITIQQQISPNVYANCDPRFMTMVVENLLSNAIKYSYENSSVTVTLTKHKKQTQLTIADTGVGIAEDDRHKLFQKFVRLDNPLSVKEGGTGLGLFLVQHIIEAHEGSIQVENNQPQGVCFVVVLPLSPRTTELRSHRL